jgi:molybdenum cofactor synthesis domain-containing protein
MDFQRMEEIETKDSLERVLAEDVRASLDLPPFNRSIFDGYAVRASDTAFVYETSPKKFKIIGKIFAGEFCNLSIKDDECIGIETGAIIPNGSDAVVKIEDTNDVGKYIWINKPLGKGEGIASRGSDVYYGQILMVKGEIITPERIGVLTGLGIEKIKVILKPRIVIFSTGNELIDIGQELGPSQIYDVNQYAIGALIQKSGCIPVFLGVKRDRLKEIRNAVKKGVRISDGVIITGSSSAGSRDFAYKIFKGLEGPGLIIHGIAVKPGKPTILAAIGNKPVFGLPGFPVSAIMMYKLVVDPILRNMSGNKKGETNTINTKMATSYTSERGRKEFVPVFLKKTKNGKKVIPIMKGSGAIASLSLADGMVEIPENVTILEKNERVKADIISDKTTDMVMVGDHHPVVDVLINKLQRHNLIIRSEFRGLEHGLVLLRDGIADLVVGITPRDKVDKTNFMKSINDNLEIVSFNSRMALACSNSKKRDLHATYALPPIGTRLRGVIEDYLKKEHDDFKVVDSWTYRFVLEMLKRKKVSGGLVPQYIARENHLDCEKIFSVRINLFKIDSLPKKLNQKLSGIIKSDEYMKAVKKLL